MRASLLALALSLALAVVLAHAPRAFAAGGGMTRVRAAGVLRWGGDLQGGEPYAYEDPHDPGHLVGFEVDLAAAIAKELGVRAEFVQNDWSNLVPSLERGTFDVAMNGLEVTTSTKERVLFTRPYYVFAERLVVRKGTTIAPTLDALRGRTVGTMTNTYAHELLRGRADVVPYEGPEEAYVDLVRGRTEAVLLDDIMAIRYAAPKPELAVMGDVTDGYYAVGVRRSEPDLAAAIDGALATIAARGELRTILEAGHVWNARQERLLGWTAADQAALVGGAEQAGAAPPRFTAEHALLFMKGAGMTLLVSTLAMCLAIPLGLALALARLYAPRAIGAVAEAYVEVYRGTPVLLQLYVLYYGLASVLKIDAVSAAVLGLGMNYAAYEAETYRSGIQAVPRGQMEAAASLGMSGELAIRRVLLPQAFRIALPNVTNDYIALLKDSALVSVVTVVELTKQMQITAVDIRSWLLPGVLCAAMYFAMSYPLSRLSRRLEARLARG